MCEKLKKCYPINHFLRKYFSLKTFFRQKIFYVKTNRSLANGVNLVFNFHVHATQNITIMVTPWPVRAKFFNLVGAKVHIGKTKATK
jgi:hypothetical protein